ncbi:phospholipase A2 A2-actitoxin-Ucs2a-like isoform X2 [Portunus trituberculatus]|uniref:phospholipase A2 A2-actitoxin-Ucs2a-like isoform X2 n=1 Tax=Portunus trituberculatus TaxID=210409 RepID=UPI001E1CFE2C|nr:phospholipase A2 A2-actitoxin-Ucs2a-like isoform X2 [Portunus trituberculatus]
MSLVTYPQRRHFLHIMKCLTIVAFVCLVLMSPVASDPEVMEADETQGTTTHTTETHQHQEGNSTRRKRSVFHLYNMVTCATSCNPLVYKGYGCYCGFLGAGMVVDGIDKCCKGHDWCYEHSTCLGFDHYLAPYRWKCNGGNPYCVATRGPLGGVNSCGHQLCECDREFVECLKQHPCPKTKAICMTSPWRNIIFLGKMGRHASLALQTLL